MIDAEKHINSDEHIQRNSTWQTMVLAVNRLRTLRSKSRSRSAALIGRCNEGARLGEEDGGEMRRVKSIKQLQGGNDSLEKNLGRNNAW